MGGKKKDTIDFNNPESMQDILKEISKDKSKNGNGKFNPVQQAITFFTTNMQLTIGLAVYVIISGLIGNVVFIINFPLIGIPVLILAILFFVIYRKFKSKKKKKKEYIL